LRKEISMALHKSVWLRLTGQQLTKHSHTIHKDGHHQPKSLHTFLRALSPIALGRDERLITEHIREGRFQRSLALVTAFSSLLSGLEATYEHYLGSYSQRVMYTPVLLSIGLCVTGVWAVFNRWAARVMLPIVSLLTIVDGVVGTILHINGVRRKPGGWRIPVFNVTMGPPLLAPLLFGISGFLGLVTTFLRREDDTTCPPLRPHHRQRSLLSEVLPQAFTRDISAAEQDIREGRFQRMMAVAAAVAAFCSGFEALYSHYKNNFIYRIEWVPILLTPLVMFAGIGTIWSRMIGKVLLPITSALALVSGMVGLFYHVRGILRRPGGAKKPLYNLIYGPPVFAPLLFSATGFLGLLASLLRRERR
jgi:hypothetical protein